MGYYNLISHIRKLEIMKVELIEKTDLLNIVINDPDLNINNFKKMKVNELRELLKITHKINGKYKNEINCYHGTPRLHQRSQVLR